MSGSRPFRALLKALVLMDLRSQHFARSTGSKPGELIPPLFWVVGQYVLASGILAVALFARVEVWAFAFCALATSMLLAGTAVVVELHEIAESPDDLAILGHRPLAGRTVAAARLLNLGFFVALVSAAANVFPAVLGTALRDSGPGFLPAYLLAATVGNGTVVALVLVLLSLGRDSPARRQARDLLAWLQILLVMVVFYGAQWMLRDRDHELLRFFARPPEWLRWLPPAWLADLVAQGAAGSPSLAGTAVALVVLGLSGLLVTLRLAARYGHAPAEAPAGGSRGLRPRPLVGAWTATLGPRPLAAATALCLAMVRRDADLRMRVLPSLATVVAVVALGLATGQLASPWTGSAATAGLSIAAVQLVVLAVPVMLHNLLFSRDHAASWVLAAAPWPSRRAPLCAARAAVCYGVALPALAVLGAVFAWSWRDPVVALLSIVLGWLEVLTVGWASLLTAPAGLPLSRPVTRGEASGGEATPWLAVVAAGVVLASSAQLAAAGSVGKTAVWAAVLLALLWAVRRRALA